MINPFNVLNKQGVTGARIQTLPNNFTFDLTEDTWWRAVVNARQFSDFTNLDALYSYILMSSTTVRSAIDKRLRPLRSRTFGIYIDGKEDERLTGVIKDSALVRELIYQRGLANFTYVRVIGVNDDKTTFVYPMRNLDVVNRAVRRMQHNTQELVYVDKNVNLFWVQSSYQSEDTLGLMQPIAWDFINMFNSQGNWQTASQFTAYQQMVMYYENGDEKMMKAATYAAEQVGLGKVIITGKQTDEITGKITKDLELENVYGSASADTFRIFKENIDQLRNQIMQLILGSSLLGMSDKNTNSERLVRAHLRLFNDILESDAIEVQDWLNLQENKVKLAYILKEPSLKNATIRAKPIAHIDVGELEIYTNMLKDLKLTPEVGFIEKAGLTTNDVSGYGKEANNADEGGKGVGTLPKTRNAAKRVADVVVAGAKRLFNRDRPSNDT